VSALVQATRFRALGTTAEVIATRPDAAAAAVEILKRLLDDVDAAASRFRPDSELALVEQQPGRPTCVSELLGQLIAAALRAARQTDGLVDPTVGSALVALGYDRDFDEVARDGVAVRGLRAPGWRTIAWNPLRREVTIPPGVQLDFGATAKAWAADRAAAVIQQATGSPVLVNLGGDIAIAGEPPAGGWAVQIADDHAEPLSADAETIALTSGGLATSTSAVRNWQRGGRTVHHIVDPATGEPAPPVWRTVSVVAASALDANTASTAAMVMGRSAPAWLERLGLAARLVATDGAVVRTGAWP
jgi:thiamine biosynthesis lipoprotein